MATSSAPAIKTPFPVSFVTFFDVIFLGKHRIGIPVCYFPLAQVIFPLANKIRPEMQKTVWIIIKLKAAEKVIWVFTKLLDSL